MSPKEAKIRISEEHGLNPIMGQCPRCRKDNGEIMLPGLLYYWWCGNCRKNTIAQTRPKDGCVHCRSSELALSGEYEAKLGDRIPGGLCDHCKDEVEVFESEIARGGVYFKCACGSQGIIKAETELAKDVRKKHPEGPVGVELTGCPICGKE